MADNKSPETNSATATNDGQDQIGHVRRAPASGPFLGSIVINDREARQRRQQTLESEAARDELLKQGIKVRDFQAEADARRYGTTAGTAGGESVERSPEATQDEKTPEA